MHLAARVPFGHSHFPARHDQATDRRLVPASPPQEDDMKMKEPPFTLTTSSANQHRVLSITVGSLKLDLVRTNFQNFP
jgi:hypothetical protein